MFQYDFFIYYIVIKLLFHALSHDLQTHTQIDTWQWEILEAFSHTDPTSTFFPRETARGRARVHITLGQKASSSQHHRRRQWRYNAVRGPRNSPKLEFRRATRWFMSKVTVILRVNTRCGCAAINYIIRTT